MAPSTTPLLERQERWASSPALAHGLKANLVAMRVSALARSEERELIWAIQKLSCDPPGLDEIATALAVPVETVAELCLNPEADLKPFACDLERFFKARSQAKAKGKAITALVRSVWDALDYCQQSRGLVMLSGVARLGKTTAVKLYCEQHPGRARYCPVPSSSDDLAFFIAIARSLGITVPSNVKAKYLRPRIEATLQGGDLALVLDDFQYCTTGHHNRIARPPRICWLMTECVNRNVPIACVVTHEFFRLQREYERKTHWSWAQWTGRVERHVQLQESFTEHDLVEVARAHLADGDRRSIEILADYASLSKSKRLAAIEHAVKQARYFASLRGDSAPACEDIKRAVSESIAASDPALDVALGKRPRAVRPAAASTPREPREAIAERQIFGSNRLASCGRD
jgi:AAA domain